MKTSNGCAASGPGSGTTIYASLPPIQMDLRLSSLASGFNDYRQAVQGWWDDLVHAAKAMDLEQRPVYFVSSNPHSLPNLLSGYTLEHRAELLEFVQEANPEGLKAEWERLSQEGQPGAQANFLYYIQRAFYKNAPSAQRAWQEAGQRVGIYRFDDPRSHDISAQIIDLGKLDPERLDPRVQRKGSGGAA